MKKEELKVGDRILLLSVPKFDKGETADALQKVINTQPVVTICEIDEYGKPWFSVENMEEEITHTFAVMDDESWEYFGEKKTFDNPEKQEIADKIDQLTAKYFKEYDALAQRSEQLYDEQKKIEQAYKTLDDKTGLSKLYAAFAKLHEEEKK